MDDLRRQGANTADLTNLHLLPPTMTATPIPAPASPPAALYAVSLRPADPQHPGRIAGRIEHVLSGRRHDFDDGATLLACLALEQQVALAAVLGLAAPSAGRAQA